MGERHTLTKITTMYTNLDYLVYVKCKLLQYKQVDKKQVKGKLHCGVLFSVRYSEHALYFEVVSCSLDTLQL